MNSRNTSNKTVVIFALAALITGAITFTSCNKDVIFKEAQLNLPSNVLNYTKYNNFGQEIDLSVRASSRNSTGIFNQPNVNSTFNDHTATLGRVLFYDTKMSINNTVSCGTCHVQSMGFADGKAASAGFASVTTPRNSMAICNPVDNNNMFWDSRASSTLDLSLQPVFNHIEMGMESEEMLVKKIAGTSYYKELFENAYGTSEVTNDKISQAISAFVNSIFSMQSKFDVANNIEDFSSFTVLEKRGKELFHSQELQCSQCHAGENFVADDGPTGAYGGSSRNGAGARGTANIGLDQVYADNGIGNGKFKIPSLRNIELTGPYMHDGRFTTLEEVVDHYSSGIQNHPFLDAKFKGSNGQAKQFNLSETDKMALVAFLKTLTDHELLAEDKFSDPFNN